MSEDEIKKVFAKNLNNYLYLSGKTQADLYKYMGVSSATVSNWCTGLKMPRMDKIQAICNWLGIEKSDLLENKNNTHKEKVSTAVTPIEFQHLNKFRSLNPAGQDKAVEYVNDLADNPKYRADDKIIPISSPNPEPAEEYHPTLIAAHSDKQKLSEADKDDIARFIREHVNPKK